MLQREADAWSEGLPGPEILGVEREWWFKRPDLVVVHSPRETSGYLAELYRELLGGIESSFGSAGCQVFEWQPEVELPPSVEEHGVVLNPIDLGRLSLDVEDALTQPDFELFVEQAKASLPEVTDKLRIADWSREAKLANSLHPNFTNVIFVEDPSGLIMQLPHERMVVVQRMLMAKQNSFRNILVPYQIARNGMASASGYILGTLEGGHPVFTSTDELARRLMVFGSAEPVTSTSLETYQGESFTNEEWHNSEAVNGMIKLGQFLGERGLLSEPVHIQDLVNDRKQSQRITGILRWGRQSEGAFYAHDPGLRIANPGQAWDGVCAVTSTGKFGAVKTDLGYGDITAVTPSGGKLDIIDTGENLKSPSVEAEEFVLPQSDLLEDFPIRLRKTDTGYALSDDGEYLVPPIRGVIHLHRGIQHISPGAPMLTVPGNTHTYPPVGCGVDLMHEMSEDAMGRALHMWESGGKQAHCAAFYVPNHGTNIFIFWTPDTSGVIPFDPFEQVKQLIGTDGSSEQPRLVFTPEVPQV